VKGRVDADLLARSITYAVERMRIETALRDLSGDLVRLQDEERRRIAREIHDTTAQSLAALSMNLNALQTRAPALDEEARGLLVASLECVTRCSRELRTATYLLHPPLLEELGLPGAVRDYADGFAARSGIRVDLELPADMARLPKEFELALFRVMQESLANALRHSGSRTASIRFVRAANELALEVCDSGRGIPPHVLHTGDGQRESLPGVGIAGMRERVRQLGGRFEIVSGSEGTTVRAILPVAAAVP
jgi:two-component system, NarL family, sensor kinase